MTERDPGDEHAETRRTLELSPDAIARLCALAKGADATVDWFVNAALDRAEAEKR